MATLLRKARAVITPNIDAKTGDHPPLPPPKDERTFPVKRLDIWHDHWRDRVNLSTTTTTNLTDHHYWQREEGFEKPTSIVQLRRRLVRKASTLSLRAKGLNSSFKVISNQTRSETAHSQQVTFKNTPASVTTVDSSRVTAASAPAETAISQTIASKITKYPSISRATAGSECSPSNPSKLGSGEISSTLSRSDAQVEHQKEEKSCDGYIVKDGIWAKMAAPSVEPPLSYEKLKQITTDACDNALTSVTKYSHAETESWNTAIINTILAALVEATSTESANTNGASSGSSAPQFKYVVNSTIIQHGVGSTNEDGKATGRRGMHSASGAYWNNEKDGMWSFKYEAAEAKGLDVVIGIVWIWVG